MAETQKFCTGCGAPLNPEDESCAKCGEPVLGKAPIEVEAREIGDAAPAAEEKPAERPVAAPAAEEKPAETPVAAPVVEDKPAQKPAERPQEAPAGKEEKPDPAPPHRSRYAPVSTFGFLLMFLLLLIPVLNIILLFVWARKNCRKVNRRSFARALLLFMLLILLFAVACYFFGDVMFGGIVTKYAGFLEGLGLQSLVDLWGK